MTSRNDQFDEQAKEAEQHATRVLGYSAPKGDPVIEAVKAAALVALPPLFGLPLFGVPMEAIEVPLLVLGIATGSAVYWYCWRKRNRWYSAYAEYMVRKGKEGKG